MLYKKRSFFIFIVLIVLLIWKTSDQQGPSELVHLQGTTMGPIPYSIKYLEGSGTSFQSEIDSLLIAFNNSLSTYIPDSEISRFNQTDTIVFESPFFYPVLARSQEVFDKSGGAFDPTIGLLINAWGFGAGQTKELDSAQVDSILMITGFDRINFDVTRATKIPKMTLDFSAIAKGYGIDVVADFLVKKGVENFMVEIGGEVACKGVNIQQKPWVIGVEKPIMELSARELMAKVNLIDRAMATSGNYRNYYMKDGRIIAHTISPFTGYPVSHSLLSASVFAENCTLADAYATAFMVLGLKKSQDIIEKIDGIDAFLVFSDESGNLQTYSSEGIRKEIELIQ